MITLSFLCRSKAGVVYKVEREIPRAPAVFMANNDTDDRSGTFIRVRFGPPEKRLSDVELRAIEVIYDPETDHTEISLEEHSIRMCKKVKDALIADGWSWRRLLADEVEADDDDESLSGDVHGGGIFD